MKGEIENRKTLLVEDYRGSLLVLDKLPNIDANFVHTTLISTNKLLLPSQSILTIVEGGVTVLQENLLYSNKSFLVMRSFGVLIETSKDFLGNLIYSSYHGLD